MENTGTKRCAISKAHACRALNTAALLAALLGQAKARADLPQSGDVVPSETQWRALVGAESGFAGRIAFDGAPIGDATQGLRSTWGFTVRIEKPLARYFTLGGRLAVRWWNTRALQDASVHRSSIADLGLMPKFRIPFASTGGNGEVYFGLPGGLSLSFLATDLGGEQPVAAGWHLGGVTGSQYFFSRRVGLFGEIGWVHHHAYHRRDALGDLRLDQLHVALGIAVLFGEVTLAGEVPSSTPPRAAPVEIHASWPPS